MRCAAEMCLNWTGAGCICAVLDLEPDVVEEHSESPCSCEAFAIWYADLKGVDAATDHVVCACGHSTREHMVSVGQCLGKVRQG